MRTILKLVVVGIIAGATYKYMSDNDISLIDAYNKFNNKVTSLVDTLESSKTSSNQSETTHNKPEPSNYKSQTKSSNSSKPVVPPAKTKAKPINFPVEKRVSAKPNFHKLDNHAMNVPESYCKDITALVEYLVKPANNELEIARTIFTWIAHNISYDDYGYNTGRRADASAQGVLKSRSSVCAGFANLFKSMAQEAGLKCEVVSGFAKGYGNGQGGTFTSTNHAWNAIKIDGQWKLFDVTWAHGSGKTVNGRLQTVREFKDFWFDTDPYAFIFSHFPENSEWQFINTTLSKTQFERLPKVQSSFFTMGFQGETILDGILNGYLKSLPSVYSKSRDVTAVSVPVSGTLKQHQPIHLVLKSPTAHDMAVINNGKWTHFERVNNTYSLTFQPEQGELKLSARFDDTNTNYYTLLNYRVR